MTQQRDSGKETMMRRQESKVMRKAHSPGPSSQAGMMRMMIFTMIAHDNCQNHLESTSPSSKAIINDS